MAFKRSGVRIPSGPPSLAHRRSLAYDAVLPGDSVPSRQELVRPPLNASDDTTGFSIHEGVFSVAELGALSAEIDHIPRTRAGARHLMSQPFIAALAYDDRMMSLASETLGERATPFRATLLDKSRASNWLIAWHQDTALPVQRRRDLPGWGPWSHKAGKLYARASASALDRVVALRLHLDASNALNGPLRVIPGSHTLGVLSAPTLQVCVRETPSVECHVGAGGVLRMRPLTVHASSKAHSTDRRRVLHIEYATTLQIAPGIELDIA